MIVKVYFFLFCFISFGVSSQNEEHSSSIEEEIFLSGSEIDKLLLETNKIRTSDFVGFAKNLTELSRNQSNFSSAQECSYRFLEAYKFGLTGNVQKSIQEFLKIKNTCTSLSMSVRIDSILANMYAISGEYQNALINLDSVLSKIEKSDDKDLNLTAYSTAFLVYDLVNQNQLSLDLAQIVIDKKPSKKQMCSASVYKYISLIKLNKTQIDENEITKVLDYCREIDEILIAQALNVNWIEYQLTLAESQDEIEFVYQSLLAANDSIMATQYKNLIVFKDSLMARILEKLGQPEEAVKYAQQALEGTVSLGDSQQKIDALQVLYNFYQQSGDFEVANELLIEKNLAESGFYSEKQEKEMAYQTIKHDTMAKTHQIEFLNQKNNMLSLENELAKKSKSNQLLLSYFFASLAVLLLYIGYRIKRKQDIYKSLSEMDYMTKIYNRKGMKDYMEYMLPYSEKKEETVAFGIFDLDLFKKINDQYGHNVGDWVIKTIVDVCKKLNNEKVTFARLGGEEFAIIMRDSSMNDIKKFAEACRKAINSIETLEETKYQFNISASFGVTTTEISGYSFSDLMSDADEALYKSKENGRDQVSAYQA